VLRAIKPAVPRGVPRQVDHTQAAPEREGVAIREKPITGGS
jgi:hypothetical protein